MMLYKGLKGAAGIPINGLVLLNRCTRDHHSLAFQTPLAGLTFHSSPVSSHRLLNIGTS